jgi:plastocyanin
VKARTTGSVRRTFPTIGRYRLVCTIHRDLGMYLTVRVKR